MQERIARDPFEALGLSPSSTLAQARTAFLQLAKTYHPARYGRMDAEIQRLANEVFLALRAAHDMIAKPLRPGASGRTGVLPVLRPQPIQPAQPTQSPPSAASAMAALAAGTARGGTTRIPPVTQPLPRAPTVPPSTRPIPQTPQTTTPRATPAEGTQTVAASPGVGADREVATALELAQKGQWDAARAALQTLVNQHPSVARYRALVSYVLGRQAQLEQRLNEARIELDRALQIDPTLQLAKTALGELFTRRK